MLRNAVLMQKHFFFYLEMPLLQRKTTLYLYMAILQRLYLGCIRGVKNFKIRESMGTTKLEL